MKTIKIPKKFYDDHQERDLPAPAIVKNLSKHYLIDQVESAEIAELLSDAMHYSDCAEWWEGSIGMQSSARATAKAIRKALPNLKPQAA